MVSLDQFRDTYLTECAELLADMEERLVGLNETTATRDMLDAIFRCAHSIKGGAGAFGFHRVAAFTHVLESLLDALREGKMQATPEVVSALLKASDITSTLLRAESGGDALAPDYEQALVAELKHLSGQRSSAALPAKSADAAAASGPQEWRITFRPHDSLYATGNDPVFLLRALRQLGPCQTRAEIGSIPPLSDYQPDHSYVSWEISLTTDKPDAAIKDVFEFVDGQCDLVVAPAAPKAEATSKPAQTVPVAETANENKSGKAAGVTSIRVDLEKIDRMVNMVGELVITQAMLHAQTKNLPLEQFTELLRGIDDLAQHTRELQEAVMAVRMQPVKSIFSRMPRVVRDTAQQLGKDIRLVMMGEETEVDKTIIEQLSDPLMHMIRNAADHGIERPDVREACGKPKQGTIELSAYHQGGRIILEVSEDGAGLNRDKILAKAREKNLIAPDAVLNDEQIEQLIFLPGFSTAEKLSNISGRGVGMDVVKRNIEGMGGNVHVASVPGKGSRFTVTLPLTLAILDGMIVRVGAEYYIIPITSIVETLRPKTGDVKSVPDGHDVLNVRGHFVPVVHLSDLFKIKGAEHDPARALVILVENGRQTLGLVVDELVGQQQVVIKSLEANADPVKGISGATILGDGKVSLILDIAALGQLSARAANKSVPPVMEQAS